jgi:hypothetical protein
MRAIRCLFAWVFVVAAASRVAAAEPDGGAVEGPADFGAETRMLMRVVACAGDAPLPKGISPQDLSAHCARLLPAMEKFRKVYGSDARKFFASLQPAGLPKDVVYPFGGGDILFALAAFPDAASVDTLSLELVGDPRRVHQLDARKLRRALDLLDPMLLALLAVEDFSRSNNLSIAQQGPLPGQLALFVTGLAVHGCEPVSLAFLHLQPDGSIRPYTASEIAASEKKQRFGKKRKASWSEPDFPEAFAHMQMAFSCPGRPEQVHRHFAVNVSDTGLATDRSIVSYLEKKGRFTAMTKAASYLLWEPGFSAFRALLLDHMEFMLSDSSGIPPREAAKAGFVQETWGSFSGPYLPRALGDVGKEMRALWAAQPRRELAFRFGYPDSSGKPHLMVTRRPAAEPPR